MEKVSKVRHVLRSLKTPPYEWDNKKKVKASKHKVEGLKLRPTLGSQTKSTRS